MPTETTPVESQSAPPSRPIRPLPRHDAKPRGRGRGGGGFSQSNRGRGRGGGYDGRRGGAGYSGPPRQAEQSQGDSYSPHTSSQMQGQNYYQQDYSSMSQQPMQAPVVPSWGYPPAGAGGVMQPSFGGQGTGMPFVQPHINPLFASALGFQMGQAQSMGYNPQFNMPPYSGGYQEPHQQQFQQPQQPWNGQWPAPGNVQHPPGGQGQG
jgi:H/ACA ribonucleoprotein complex non-core subunit NAF1